MYKNQHIFLKTVAVIFSLAISIIAVVYVADYWSAKHIAVDNGSQAISRCVEYSVPHYENGGWNYNDKKVPATTTIEQCENLKKAFNDLLSL